MSSSPSIYTQQSMSALRNRKRPNPDGTAQDSPPAKRIKSDSAVQVASNFPPEFWDSLSKVWLTSRALREKDRRNSLRSPAAPIIKTAATLARFARRGGPDLGHLRGYPEPEQTAEMNPNRSSVPSTRRTKSTNATNGPPKVKRSSAYDRDFEQKLVDCSIYPKGHEFYRNDLPEPDNLDDITRTLSAPRGSLSPSRFDQTAFKTFTLANDRVLAENVVMSEILPTILGNHKFPSAGNIPFTNLDTMTDGRTVDAVPDLYDGLYPDQVDQAMRQDLNKTIIPSTNGRAPIVPNFFLEAKAPRGGADIAKRQACLDGALGARAMHSLQTYGEETQENPSYHGNAYTFTSTYHDGTLRIYTHHTTAPTAEGQPPGYHMTQVRAFNLTDTPKSFIEGATALRNARDLARQRREGFLQAAKAKVSQQQPVATVENNVQLQDDHLAHGSPEDSETGAWQDAHDDLQQHIAETHSEVNEEHDDAPATPQQQSSSDSSDDSAHHATASVTDDSSRSFVSSFTSNSNTDSTRPKRSRLSASSPTQGSRSPKSRSRFTTNRNAALREPGPSESVISYWIQTYGYEEKVLFRNPEGQEIKTDLKDWKQETINGAQYFYWQCPKSGRVFGAKEWPGVEKN
ncbi:uncharacterized protein BBA_03210 [Beauveria bassiana ARSEF 2860]|uniref:DUF7924 domain-containing protein n=1 Tax=Beauveria bassiana (strain ARSEF 2860) TaxID=655819 RepID=J4WBE1_BEAB2|nr:uncharacterized protein BBA_03210 [Beauveria bassiana ARSEF 2860]EJP67430.1 hypothetical protein BBA_03210 [Beauveria bassiana ARSEF 2860]